MLKATLILGLWRPSSESQGQEGVGSGDWRRRTCQRWNEGPAPTSADPVLLPHSVIIPEKLDSFINKFAEYTHEKWAFDKVGTLGSSP